MAYLFLAEVCESIASACVRPYAPRGRSQRLRSPRSLQPRKEQARRALRMTRLAVAYSWQGWPPRPLNGKADRYGFSLARLTAMARFSRDFVAHAR